jgi:hypothetical protein
MGLFGQMIAVFPSYDAVLVVTSAIAGPDACSGHLLPMMQKHLRSLFPEKALRDAGADTRLEARLARMAAAELPVTLEEPSPAYFGALDYSVLDNPLGIRRLSLDLSREACALRLTDTQGEYTIVAGVDRWIEGQTDIRGEHLHHGYHLTPARVVAGARWLAPDRLEMIWIFVETTFRDTIVCHFSGDQLTFCRSVNVNSGGLKQPDLTAIRSPR